MRAWLFAIAIVASAIAWMGAPGVARAGQPRELCYSVSEDLGGPWEAWIAGAASNWNDANEKAGIGWRFVPCKEGQTPDIKFVTISSSPGGAQGGPEGCQYVIRIMTTLRSNQEINGVHVNVPAGESGWNIHDPPGETTLDPVLVIEHELSHAMGVDGDLGRANSGNVSNTFSPGNHGKPPGTQAGRSPSATDIQWVKDANPSPAAVAGAALGEAAAAACPANLTNPAPAPTPAPPKSEDIAPEHSCAPRAPTPLETGMLRELDAARADPPAYASRMRPMPYVDITETVASLKQQAAAPPLTYNACLASAAIAQAEDQGPKGGESHVGSDGSRPNERMQAAGVTAGKYGEVIAIFYTTAAGMMTQLLADLPGPAHPHRDEIFDPSLAEAGVGCGPNAKFGVMCVVDLASSPLANGASGFTKSQRVTNSCWIDARTGEHVKTYPEGTEDSGDPNQRSRPTHRFSDGTTVAGQDFVRLGDGSWIDARTGEAVKTYPEGTEDSGDPNQRSRPTHRFSDGTTVPGQDFVRVPCPP